MPDLYLLHFAEPLHHARHYLGYAVGTGRGRAYAQAQCDGRAIGAHEIVMAAQWSGIELHVAAIFPGAGRAELRRLRASHNHARHCPYCTGAAPLPLEAS